MKSLRDAILGRLAIEQGLVTEEQLRECLRDRKSGSSGEETSLGEILLRRGLLRREDLDRLLRERDRRFPPGGTDSPVREQDYLFGQLLVKLNKATQLQINKCLEIQRRRAEQGGGPVPRLGELLVEHGYVDRATVAEILALQAKRIFSCTGCGRSVNVLDAEGERTYRCRECGGILVRRQSLESLRADETFFGFELPTEEK